MPTPFSSEDLGRMFDARTLTRGRSLVLIGAVEVALTGDVISAVVEDGGSRRTATITPASLGRRVMFDGRCSCGTASCTHLAAALLASLDRFPVLRKAEQKSFLEALSSTPAPERRRLAFDLSPVWRRTPVSSPRPWWASEPAGSSR